MLFTGNIKLFCILWSVYMALYFFFSTSDPVWYTSFYCVTILLARNNINEAKTKRDVMWKKVGVLLLDILMVLFIMFYLEPKLNTELVNNIIGYTFLGIPIGGLIYERFV